MKVYFIDAEGNYSDMNAVRDGNYMVFETDHFSRYIITCGADVMTSLVWLIIVLAVVAAIGAVLVVVRIALAKKRPAVAEGEEAEADAKAKNEDNNKE